MGFRYCVPLPGPFYYSGRVGSKRWLPRSSTGCGPMGFMVKCIVYPSIVFFGAGLAIVAAPFYGVFWVVRCWQRNRWKYWPVAQPVVQCFPVRRPLSQCSALGYGARSYGFVPDRRPVRPALPMVSSWLRRASSCLAVVEADRDGVPEVWGVSSAWLALHLPFRDRMGRRMLSYAACYCIPRCSGVMGRRVRTKHNVL